MLFRRFTEVHEGFLAGYRALQPGVAAALELFGGPNVSYVNVTGHSLGAALAEIATFELIAAGAQYIISSPSVSSRFSFVVAVRW